MRDIIGRAGSSNATLVKYFGNKDGLFAVYVAEIGSRLAAASIIGATELPEVALKRVGRQILEVFIPEIRVYRAALSAINNNPDVGPFMMDHTGGSIERNITSALKRWSQEGRLRSDDVNSDANRFLQMLKTGVWERVLFARQNSTSTAEISRAADAAVRVFLHGVGNAL